MNPIRLLDALTRRVLISAIAVGTGTRAWTQTPATPETDEDVIELSPFSVEESANDIGYYAENTMAGSRMNSNLGDIAAAISVVTAQQLQDTAAVDINDVFLYEANTEGTGNYTSISVGRNGEVNDAVQNSPESANRVRGIGSADTAMDYFVSLRGMPADAYNVSRLTINRGPNSILFGLGSPSGIVNQSPSRARINNESTSISLRAGSWDSYRGSFNMNRTVIPDALAVYFAALYDDRGFRRKPSYDTTQRLYGALTFKPFPKTTIRSFYEHYENHSRRPNSVTPQDQVTAWREAGSPTWNPSTWTATVNGVETAPITSDANLPTGLGGDDYSRPAIYMDHGEVLYWQQRRTDTRGLGINQGGNEPRRTTRSLSDVQRFRSNLYPLFTQPGVTDRSIYDWEHINLVSGNTTEAQGHSINVVIEQQILDNLFLELGWFEQSLHPSSANFLNAGGNTLYIDTNETLTDGAPNPFFRRPYLETNTATVFKSPQSNKTFRGMLAYELSFADRDNWTHWLGRHRVLGLYEDRELMSSTMRFREAVTSEHAWASSYPWSGPNAQQVIHRRWYVGGTDGNVNRDTGRTAFGNLTFPIRYFDPASGEFVSEEATLEGLLFSAGDSTRQEIESQSFAVQNYLWGDRIVLTWGARKDKSSSVRSNALERTDGGTGDRIDPANFSNFDGRTPDDIEGITRSRGAVVHPFRDLDALPEWLHELSFHYNESDNFSPAGVAIALDGEVLPAPSGDGKDYGVGISLWNNKLSARFNWYEAGELNSRAGSQRVLVGRTGRIDQQMFVPWIRQSLLEINGVEPSDAEVNAVSKLPADFFGESTLNQSTTDITSEGFEVTLTYNPLRSWNMRFTAGQQETIESNIAPRLQRWWAERLAVWSDTTLNDVNFFTKMGGPGLGDSDTAESWFNRNVLAPMSIALSNEGKRSPQQREWRWSFISNYRFSEGFMKNVAIGGGVRWEDQGAIGFLGDPDDPNDPDDDPNDPNDGVIRTLLNDPVFDDSRYYFDLWASYNLRAFEDVNVRVQLNVRNAFESGELRPVAVNPDGNPFAYRIIDPREIILTTTFEF